MSLDLDPYFERLGYGGSPRADLTTLRELHRLHLLAIPYENLDIHLGRPLALDQSANLAKLVNRRRGGWCYEMNGVLALVLERLGFRVSLLSGTVGRDRGGEANEGNHLVLLVDLDRPYLADVGFGDGFIEPIPLEVGRFSQEGFDFALARDGDRWLVQSHPFGAAPGFDFTLTPRRLDDFRHRALQLATSADSGFVQKTVCQRWRPGGIVTLRGAVRRWVTPSAVSETTVENEAAFRRTLHDDFGLVLDDTAGLWAAVEERHRRWVAERRA